MINDTILNMVKQVTKCVEQSYNRYLDIRCFGKSSFCNIRPMVHIQIS